MYNSMKEMIKKHLDTLLLLLCFTPTYFWYIRRMTQGSMESMGDDTLSALILPLVIFLGWMELSERKKKKNAPPQERPTGLGWITLAGVALYVALWVMGCPALIKAIIAVTVLLLHFRLFSRFGIAGMAYLTLPWLSSFQHFLGYPLRRVVTEMSAMLINLMGLPVATEGTGILFRNRAVFVDPPCSGVKMFWAALFLSMLLSALYRASWKKGIAVSLLSVLLAISGNIMRGTVLFFPEAHLVKWPDWTHDVVGLLSYFCVCLSLLGLLAFIHRPHDKKTITRYVTPH